MATLKDVAALAHCDVSTVSRALNNTSYVHPETKARIMAAVKELSYKPNVIARGLRRGRLNTIAVVIPKLSFSIFSEVASGIASLIASGIDCVCNLTDNNVVNNFSVVTAATDPAGIPCYGSEEEQVARYGCVGSETLDYVALGYQTGLMAAEILGGADAKTMAVYIVSDSEPVFSTENMAKFGLALPDAYKDAREVK